MPVERVESLKIAEENNFLIDIDGVLIRGNALIPSADEFIQRLHDQEEDLLRWQTLPSYDAIRPELPGFQIRLGYHNEDRP
ncbi:MAG: hypothetical protein EHM41_17270 [Chloroflexi bacterium]|nr:MAG: hypothetical protein EHM41_17270 [Chloroflexota bacterium]